MNNIPRIGFFLICFLCLPAWPQSSLDSLVASAEQFESDGQWEKAASVYEQILKIDPISIPALNRLGAIRVRRGEYRKGIELYERAYKLNPSEYATNLNLGIAFIKMQDYRSAIAPLTRAVSTGPDQPQPRELLGVALIAYQNRGVFCLKPRNNKKRRHFCESYHDVSKGDAVADARDVGAHEDE